MPVGTDLKFRITTTKDDFTLAGCPFFIIIKNSYGRVVKRIQKTDCFFDTEGRWYFNVENIKEGMHTAVFVGVYEDDDYAKQQRAWTDIQPLYDGTTDCWPHHHHCCSNTHEVQYEQVWTVNLADGEYLADRDGNFVYTSDGQRISFSDRSSTDGKVRLSMTGNEFLKLIEGREPNNEINTIPELFDAARGISDDKTIIEEIEDEIDEDTPERVTPEDLAHFQI